jgi:hypothetical protein
MQDMPYLAVEYVRYAQQKTRQETVPPSFLGLWKPPRKISAKNGGSGQYLGKTRVPA